MNVSSKLTLGVPVVCHQWKSQIFSLILTVLRDISLVYTYYYLEII